MCWVFLKQIYGFNTGIKGVCVVELRTENFMDMDLRVVGKCAVFTSCNRISELELPIGTATLQGTEAVRRVWFKVTSLQVKIAHPSPEDPEPLCQLSRILLPGTTDT